MIAFEWCGQVSAITARYDMLQCTAVLKRGDYLNSVLAQIEISQMGGAALTRKSIKKIEQTEMIRCK